MRGFVGFVSFWALGSRLSMVLRYRLAGSSAREVHLIDSTRKNELAEGSAIERSYGLRVLEKSKSPYVDYPMRVGIETYAVCNAACDFCPYPTMKRKGQRMSDELLEKILNDLEEIPSDVHFSINPSRINEPFLDKRLLPLLERINQRFENAGIILFTNGSPLTESVLDRLACIDRIELLNVSFNDHRRDEYERVMKLPYDRTVEILDELHCRLVSGRFPIAPRISRVGDGTVVDGEFLDWCGSRWPGFRAMVSPRMDWMGKVQCGNFTMTPDVPCMQWFTLQILADGRDAYCCTDHDAEKGFGNIQNSTLLELYNHDQRRRLRVQLPSRRQVAACVNCPLLG